MSKFHIALHCLLNEDIYWRSTDRVGIHFGGLHQHLRSLVHCSVMIRYYTQGRALKSFEHQAPRSEASLMYSNDIKAHPQV